MRDAFETVSAAVVGHLATQVAPPQSHTNLGSGMNSGTMGGMGNAMVEMNVSTPFDISALFATPSGISPIDVVDQVTTLQPTITHSNPSASMQLTRSDSSQAPHQQQGMVQTTAFSDLPDLWSLPFTRTPEERVVQPKTVPGQNERWSVSNALSSFSDQPMSTTSSHHQSQPRPGGVSVPFIDVPSEVVGQSHEEEEEETGSATPKQATSSTLQQSTFDTIENFFSNPFSELASVEGLTCSIGAFLNDTRPTKQAKT